MKAVAKMVRVNTKGEETPIEAFMSPSIVAALEVGETVHVRLWHGACLESQVEVTVVMIGDQPRTVVKLVSKQELRADAPDEALTC